jgi:pyrroloquinoline quinone (PQQ) biosynthesis protein C
MRLHFAVVAHTTRFNADIEGRVIMSQSQHSEVMAEDSRKGIKYLNQTNLTSAAEQRRKAATMTAASVRCLTAR